MGRYRVYFAVWPSQLVGSDAGAIGRLWSGHILPVLKQQFGESVSLGAVTNNPNYAAYPYGNPPEPDVEHLYWSSNDVELECQAVIDVPQFEAILRNFFTEGVKVRELD